MDPFLFTLAAQGFNASILNGNKSKFGDVNQSINQYL